ncbi:major royal jelly protein 1-like [Anoplophora glabripennis]|uniref:major royal jelly protein 1-like n=1 Tax=Anoplophora glabripennis TaxID=217634 RepID=UPI0008754118|nr:major royal jelly protein 1-like [Anoplophora glabripennis]
MGIYSTICLATVLRAVVYGQSCTRNIVPDLSFKLTGSDVAFPCDSTKNIYKTTGRYVPKNIIATRMQIYKDQAIIALPRYKHGVPFTLATFSLKSKGCKATLKPFPCWDIQEEGNCDALQNAADICIDPLDNIWVLDIGLVNTLEQPVRRCPPKIVGIDLKTGLVVKVINLDSFVTPESRLQYLIADYSKDGRPYAYVADGGAGAIIVFDITAGTGYRVVLPKAAGGGLTESCSKDVLYIQLIRKPSGNNLYFTYLSNPRLFSIKTEYLQSGKASGAVIDVGAKPLCQKIVLLGTDNGAGIFFRYKGESDIFIWNSETSFKQDNFILVQKGDDCRLATEVVAGYRKLMWAIESNFHDYILNTSGCLGPSMAVHPLIKTCD